MKWTAYCPVCGEEMKASVDPAISPSYCDKHADDDDWDDDEEDWDDGDDGDDDDDS